MSQRSSVSERQAFSRGRDRLAARRTSRIGQSAGRVEESTNEILGMPLEQYLLLNKVPELEQELWHARRSNLTQFIALVGRIYDMSQRLFPGPVSIDYASDPEDTTNEYLVFDVVANGEFADYKERIFQWHDEIDKLYPNVLSEFRLIVHPIT